MREHTFSYMLNFSAELPPQKRLRAFQYNVEHVFGRRLLRSCIEAVVGLAEIWLGSALFYTMKLCRYLRLKM